MSMLPRVFTIEARPENNNEYGSREGRRRIHTLFRDSHEGVGRSSREHRVNGDRDTAVGAIFEANGEGNARGQLAVKLALRELLVYRYTAHMRGDLPQLSEHQLRPRMLLGKTSTIAIVVDRSHLQSARYWGEIVSSSSEPTGTPESVMSHSSWRAMRKPLFILKEPLMSGSLMSPFQPTVVRGFYGRQCGAG